ncbi:sigma 54-interacting transcriptional regulator [Nannocystis pusilla]|uniref:Sigma 54-interacting transcriptional regulator n=1 Tax=Nannocystis pusilla TaxID=889268 RepID=A0ABS7TTV6_9BACT|nr:sigma 54-interacting transcriptional regulator [Nannocystis pusilla]
MPSNAQETTISAEPPRRSVEAPPTARLVIVYPRALARVIDLDDGAITLGRHAGGKDMRAVEHPTVSRRHAVVRWDAGAASHCIADLGSRNGTRLDGQAIATSPRFLVDQTVLRIGDVLVVYERGAVPGPAPHVDLDALPGESLAARRLRAAVARAAVDRAPVLVLGETGAGKESVAAELHRLSGRRGPLVVVNCAALSAQLVESQLFGHVRGAFTGATGEHAGMFRAAAGGTLFLDEVGELPLDLQPKLLRAVELGEVVAVGSTQPHRIDVRVIAATNRSLAAEVAAGRFRRDLHARLALWEVEVPFLRARRADIVDWIDRLHRQWCAPRGSVEPLEFAVEAVESLLLGVWTDNLRALQRFVHGCGKDLRRVERDALPRWIRDETPATPDNATPDGDASHRPHIRPRPTRDELLTALAAHAWSLRATARHFSRDRKQIARWVDMYAIEIPGRVAD